MNTRLAIKVLTEMIPLVNFPNLQLKVRALKFAIQALKQKPASKKGKKP